MNEAFFRLGSFLILFALLGLAETFHPCRALRVDKAPRWGSNLGLLVVDVLAQRLTLGAIVLSAALLAHSKGWGLFHLIDAPAAIEAVVTLLVLDAAIYLQHVATHKVPLLWRLHQVHHTDLDVDLSTGLRFHPVEILFSALYKAGIVLVLGADPLIVLRGGIECVRTLHPCQPGDTAALGPAPALCRLHARHAPAASFD